MDWEQAQRALESELIEDALEKRLGQAPTLPEPILIALRSEQESWSLRHASEDRREKLAGAFGSISDRTLAHVAEVMLPGLAPSVISGWNCSRQRPFQRGWYRKPFRCPAAEEPQNILRGAWLLRLADRIGNYDKDVEWVAIWARYLVADSKDLAWLLAGALDLRDDTSERVLNVLRASIAGDHEIAIMGHHVTQALMASNLEEAWELNEGLLLSAQRQEGLRQSILEAADESHPEAFRRLLRLILENDLGRFSSTVRAFDTWFGFLWEGGSLAKVNEVLEQTLGMFEDPEQRAVALHGTDPEQAYLALWTLAFEDVETAIPPASTMLESSLVEHRFVAAHLLAQADWGPARGLLVRMLDDDDLRVAARALMTFAEDRTRWVESTELFEALERLKERIQKRSVKLDSIVWPWWDVELKKSSVADAICVNGSDISAIRLVPHVKDLEPPRRVAVLRDLSGLPKKTWHVTTPRTLGPLDGEVYELVLDLLGDASPGVCATAFEALDATPVRQSEVDRLVQLLSRKAGGLRNGCLERLTLLEDGPFLAVAEQLISDNHAQRRLAGLELLRAGAEAQRAKSAITALAEGYRRNREALTDAEVQHLETLLGPSESVPTRDDALGLVDPDELIKWPEPALVDIEPLNSGAAGRCIEALAALLVKHREFEVEVEPGKFELLLEGYSTVVSPMKPSKAVEREEELPLRDVWKAWVRERSSELRDPDGLELVRAMVALGDGASWGGPHAKALVQLNRWSSHTTGRLRKLLEWCIWWEPPEGCFDLLLDGLEGHMAMFSESDQLDADSKTFRDRIEAIDLCRTAIETLKPLLPGHYLDRHAHRFFSLARGLQLRTNSPSQISLDLSDFLRSYRMGGLGSAGEAELTDLLVGRPVERSGIDIYRLSQPSAAAARIKDPEFLAVIERCRARIVEIETQRGDRETAATELALSLRWSGGLETLTQAMAALGRTKFARNSSWSRTALSRKHVLSQLVLRSSPREQDTVEAFTAWVRAAGVSDERLVELAAYAPQWSRCVDQTLGWPGFDSAVWWLHAHTKEDDWRHRDMRELWAGRISEWTPLSAQDLMEGAVDVDWFRRAYGELGAERWDQLDKAAKYASSSGGHKRAQLFADVMTGAVKPQELYERIERKRHQDAVRALGLAPLGGTAKGKGTKQTKTAVQQDLLDRYERLQAFKRESRKFGSQRQQSEGRAVMIGMENLARTAGFRDPQRLQWDMERRALGDLAEGPVVLSKGEVAITLSVDADGAPHLSVARGERKLKGLPVKLRKDPQVVELKTRLKGLRQQASRVRASLEEAMCRGDVFEGSELAELLAHPILAPSLRRIVFVGDEAIDGLAGFPAEGGRILLDHAGKREPVRKREALRIAHPVDLLERGDWTAWQRECFKAERVQPFKQVFREVYPLTETERANRTGTQRYAGHQVGPRQALALLGGRGWVLKPEEGVVKNYHHEGLAARLFFDEAFHTPAEVEGLTLEEVQFTHKGRWEPLALDQLPPRVFSETMRDLDLVVSVAHQGGVDPEATASTIEMRAALVASTCDLLGLDNVEVKQHHAIIRGQLAEYSIHLGSAVAHLLGGPALVIVAVHSQHRGRLFLPFADDDPRTAETLSKVLLLARDERIKDPNILDQIRSAGS